MKIQCDVCSKKEASVFCTADEAALCELCDHRVHHANKLASKHERFSLLQPSLSHFPICDICQEKRALIFCQEDRAILCRECDIPLHTTNEYTKKHNRFLLTGIKLSTTTTICCDHTLISKINDVITVNNDDTNNNVPDYFKSMKNPTTSFVTKNSKSNNNMTVNYSVSDDKFIICGASNSTSNISDYLIETLPEWHFDDFVLDPTSNATSATSFGFSNKIHSGNNNNVIEVEDLATFFDVEQYEKNLTSNDSTQSQTIWVPQAQLLASTTTTTTTFGSYNQGSSTLKSVTSGFVNGTKQQETRVNAMKNMSRKCRKDEAFTVPQITSSTSANNKRIRSFW